MTRENRARRFPYATVQQRDYIHSLVEELRLRHLWPYERVEELKTHHASELLDQLKACRERRKTLSGMHPESVYGGWPRPASSLEDAELVVWGG